MLRFLTVLLFFLSFNFTACNNDRVPVEEYPPIPQDEVGVPPQVETRDVPDHISDEEIEMYVTATIRAEEEWVDAESDPAAMEAITMEEGLSLERYIEIEWEIQDNPQLRDRVHRLLEEEREEQQIE